MPVELWVSAQREIDQLVTIISANPAYSIQEVTEDYDELVERSPADEPDGNVRIRGSIISFVDRLDDEFTKSLQNLDPHGTEYVDRLKDEKGLYCTICRAQALYENTRQLDPLARVIMRRLEHIYSKVGPHCCTNSCAKADRSVARRRFECIRVDGRFLRHHAFTDVELSDHVVKTYSRPLRSSLSVRKYFTPHSCHAQPYLSSRAAK